MLQKIYEQMTNFYDSIEEEYGPTLVIILTGNMFILNF